MYEPSQREYNAFAHSGLRTFKRRMSLEALREYEMRKRTNPVMVSVVNALSEKQISALAAYFSTAKAPGAGGPTR